MPLKSLKDKWDHYNNDSIQQATKEKDSFSVWCEKNPIGEMVLSSYTNLVADADNGGEYFTQWMERKTATCGRFATITSFSYGVYRVNKQGDPKEYKTAEQRTKKDSHNLNETQAAQYFNEAVKPIIIKLVNFEDMDSVRPLEINFARKIAYMHNPGELLPIFKKETIEEIAKFLGLTVDSSNYKATEVILKTLTEKWELGDPDFNLTQKLGGFLFKYFGRRFSLEYKNIIYCGAPGTGKTYSVIEGVKQCILVDGDNEAEVLNFAQFHPSYSYEDFIEGLKPVTENGAMQLKLQSGRFKQFCKKAMDSLKSSRKASQEAKKYYFIADEINRAELSRVLGEVLVCLEDSKRIDFDKEGNVIRGLFLELQYGHLDTSEDAVLTINEKHYFGVPTNLYFIGTMNDIDRSIDSFDLALRRRFVWKRKECNYAVIKTELSESNSEKDIENYVSICESLNNLIADTWGLGRSYEIGHAYFLDIGRISNSSMEKLFNSKLAPLLTEYLRTEYSIKEIEDKLKKAEEEFSLGNA